MNETPGKLGEDWDRNLLSTAGHPYPEAQNDYDAWGTHEVEEDQPTRLRSRTQLGGAFVFDTPATPPCIWGSGQGVIWAAGESLMVCGPAGVGKTTVAIQIVAARCGIREWPVLGMPVTPTGSRVLYLAMDRPPQISRAMGRLFDPAEREALNGCLTVWKGPPPNDMAKDPDTLARMAEAVDADTIVIDSVKDAFTKLTDDEAAANYNRCRQFALVRGIEVLELHHQRKAVEGRKPTKIDDVYGSTWITAGAGSVLMMWGQPGDPVIEMTHIKQPCEEVGPWQIKHDHTAGISSILDEVDLYEVVKMQRQFGLTIHIAAQYVFGSGEPTPSQLEKARRRLIRLVGDGLLVEREGERGAPSRFFLRDRSMDQVR